MGYADHARRYLATLEESEETTGGGYEINEINEKRVGTRERAEPPPGVAAPAAERFAAGEFGPLSEVFWAPPRGCLAPIVCARLDYCDRRLAGLPCTTVTTGGAERREGVA